jgi:YD repeat-containing protein
MLPAVYYNGLNRQPATTYGYDPNGNKVSMTEPLGNVSGCGCAAQHTWIYAYDDLGRELFATDPLGNETSYTYDANGNQLTSTTPRGNVSGCNCSSQYTTTSTYDADNELLTRADPLGDQSTYGYNADGKQICSSDPNASASGYSCASSGTVGRTITTYTALGRIATQADPLGHVTTYYYDADNNMIAFTEGEGNPQTCDPATTGHCAYTYYLTYDHADRMTSSTTPATATLSTGVTTNYTWDADGNRHTVTDPLGQVATYSYDGLDEVTGLTYSNTAHSTPNVTFTYTNESQSRTMVDGTGTTTYSYDADGRTTQVQNGAGATVSYVYDLNANPTCIAYPGASQGCNFSPSSSNTVVDYTYDHDDRMSSITDWAGDVLSYTYTHDSLPQTLSANSSAVVEQTTFDHADRATDISTTAGSTTLLDLAYLYDGNGNPAEESPTIGTSAQTVENLAVNSANQVNTYWTGNHNSPPSPNVTHGGDGELTQLYSVTPQLSYDQASELCWTYSSSSSNGCSSPPSGATAYSYNGDSQRAGVTPSSGNSLAYAWNAAGSLVCANTNGTTCSLSSPTSTTTLYSYDGNGLRSSSTINSTTPERRLTFTALARRPCCRSPALQATSSCPTLLAPYMGSCS